MLDRGIFDGCSFVAADLTGCSVRDVSLRRCNLARARLGGLNIGALPALRPFGAGSSGGATLVPARGVGDARDVVEAAAAMVAGPSSRGGDNTRAGEEMIGKVGVSADRAVVAVLSGDGRCAKVRCLGVGGINHREQRFCFGFHEMAQRVWCWQMDGGDESSFWNVASAAVVGISVCGSICSCLRGCVRGSAVNGSRQGKRLANPSTRAAFTMDKLYICPVRVHCLIQYRM